MSKQIEIIIGIDPGVETGVAAWIRNQKELSVVSSMSIIQAIDFVRTEYAAYGNRIFVRVEDARKRKWFGKQAGQHALQGAGSIKRDAKIWEDFLTDKGIPFEMIHPMKNGTKLKSDIFKQITKWQGVTNEHGRDAAMLVYGL